MEKYSAEMTRLTPFLFLLFGSLLGDVSAFAAILEGPISNPANGHSYYLLDPKTWKEAEKEAVSLGGHLVTINDAAEQSWVVETFGNPQVGIWIGLTDDGTEGTWRWISGQPLIYTNWAPGEPNSNGVENWGHLWPVGISDVGGMWNDAPEQPMYAVVEIEGTRASIEVASVAISWQSTANKLYQVQWSTKVDSDNWSDIGGLVVGNGQTNTVFDSVVGVSRKFYRVIPLHE